MDLHKVELLRLEVSTQCGCGEPLARGEQVGFEPMGKELLCLWCLADLTAGRARPRRRPPRDVTPHAFGAAASTAGSPTAGTSGWEDAGSANTGSANIEPSHTSPSRPRPSRRRQGPATASTLAVAVLLVAVALVGVPRLLATNGAQASDSGARSALGDIAMGAPITPVAPTGSGLRTPPVPSDARSSRLRPAPVQQSGSTHYSFLRVTPSGRAVGFDPCRPIHLVVNSDESPREGGRLIAEAAERVSAATGLVLTIDGGTSETARISRPSVDEQRYGNRWAPVLVAWTHDSAASGLSGPVVGLGGPAMAPFHDESDMHYVTGAVLLDAPDFERMLDQPDGRDLARAVIMHELGHLVGLAHVADQRQLMFQSMLGQIDFADGDLEGLRQLGSGPCFSQ